MIATTCYFSQLMNKVTLSSQSLQLLKANVNSIFKVIIISYPEKKIVKVLVLKQILPWIGYGLWYSCQTNLSPENVNFKSMSWWNSKKKNGF